MFGAVRRCLVVSGAVWRGRHGLTGADSFSQHVIVFRLQEAHVIPQHQVRRGRPLAGSDILTGALPTDAANDYWKLNLANPDAAARSVQSIYACLPK